MGIFVTSSGMPTSTQYLIKGKISKEQAEKIAKELLANELIEHWRIVDFETCKKSGMDIVIPKVKIPHKPAAKEIDLNVSDRVK